MNLAYFISKRYLLAKKSHNAINIITSISITLVAIGTMALIIIMSVFNGLEELIGDLDSNMNPDFVVETEFSKYINKKDFPFSEIKEITGFKQISGVLQDVVALKYTPALEGDIAHEFIAKIRGVESNYTKITNINTRIIDGVFTTKRNGMEQAVLSDALAGHLGIHINDFDNPIHCYFPKANSKISLNPMDAISIKKVFPAGVYFGEDKIMFTSLSFAQELMELPDKTTYYFIDIDNNTSESAFQEKLKTILGEKYIIKNKREQNVVMYNLFKTEKWSSFLILSFILFIATFNLVGALSVLIIDKQKDIRTLNIMGANKKLISKIFLIEGFMVTFIGTLFGLLMGTIIVLAQDFFHIISLPQGFVVDAFPVELRFIDIASILAVVVFVSMIAVIYPIQRLSKISYI